MEGGWTRSARVARGRCVVHVVKCGARAVLFSLSFFLHVVVFVVVKSAAPRGVVVVRGRLHRHVPRCSFRVVRNSRTHFRLTDQQRPSFGYGAPNAFDWLKFSSLGRERCLDGEKVNLLSNIVYVLPYYKSTYGSTFVLSYESTLYLLFY